MEFKATLISTELLGLVSFLSLKFVAITCFLPGLALPYSSLVSAACFAPTFQAFTCRFPSVLHYKDCTIMTFWLLPLTAISALLKSAKKRQASLNNRLRPLSDKAQCFLWRIMAPWSQSLGDQNAAFHCLTHIVECLYTFIIAHKSFVHDHHMVFL